nr:TPA_asm: m102.4 sORF 2 [Murid betaherpesvirus 1]DBA08049.1 TPA_asm: m102.4 sORF 2 [Murid betaherpesvirus 1]
MLWVTQSLALMRKCLMSA